MFDPNKQQECKLREGKTTRMDKQIARFVIRGPYFYARVTWRGRCVPGGFACWLWRQMRTVNWVSLYGGVVTRGAAGVTGRIVAGPGGKLAGRRRARHWSDK